ncbi:MAG TPA: hypothetical protein VF228_04920 [Iamia sp.]
MRNLRPFVGVLGLVAALLWSDPASSQGDPDPTPPDEESVSDDPVGEEHMVDEGVLDAMAADSLVERFGLSREEAERQVALQEPAQVATEELTRSIPLELQGGFHIDRDQGGALVVSVTAADLEIDTDGFDVPVVVRVVDQSTAELTEVSDEIRSRLSDPAELNPIVDVASNTVKLRLYGPAGEAAARLADELVATYGEAVVSIGETFASRPATRGCSPAYVYCSRPLRGGVTVIPSPMNGNWCTNGFMVRSKSDAKWYALTAGHCAFSSSSKWRTRQYPSNTISQIGSFHNFYYGEEADTGIIKVDNPDPPSGWVPSGWVNVKASGSTTEDGTYSISGVGTAASIPMGYLLCTTGTSAGSGCGPLTGIEVCNDDSTCHLGEVDLSTCNGDSGAPFYKNHLGYGILHGGIHGNPGIVNPGMGTGSFSVSCGSPTWYQGLGAAMGHMNVELG